MTKRWFYQEELFFADKEECLEKENQDKIIDMLSRNVAVGVIGGFYEEGFPVYFVSSFALSNMGMTFEQFMEETDGYCQKLVYEDDRKIFTRDCPLGEEDIREYRIINGSGESVWVREIRTQSHANDGRTIWIGAIRMIEEEQRENRLSREAIRMLQDAYFRISAIDLAENTIVNLKLVESEREEVDRLNGDYVKTIDSCAQKHVEESDRENFTNIMAPENLKGVFLKSGAPLSFSYKRLVDGKWKWVRTELVPVDQFSEENASVMWYVKNISEEKAKETEMTDQLLRTNAELVQAKKELERANRKIRESNYKLRRTLSAEEQYRQAIVSEAVFVYHVNVSRNLIEEDFYEILDEMKPVLPQVGLQAPCNADEFFQRWSREKVAVGDREIFLQTTNCAKLLESYEKGEIERVMEIETMGIGEKPMILRHTILLTRDEDSGDILALNNAKDITDIRKKDRESRKALLDAYEAADRASCAKTEFLSKMSHDIRTPMNAIIGMTAIAGTKLHDPKGLEECLGKVSAASSQLLSLINEVLDMSRIEAGAMAFHEESFNLSEMADHLLTVLSVTARKKGQKIEVCMHECDNPDVVGDAMRIQQVLMNVANNALQYTQKGGEIRIDIMQKPSLQSHIGCYEFVFQDNGIGMSEEFLERIYEPFERAEDARISKSHGTGLGLTISRNMIQLMGGDIEIESAPGKGTTVTIMIPLKYQEPGQTQQEETPSPEHALDQIEEADYSSRRVLVVEDNDLNREIAMEILSMTGAVVETAENGKQAVEMVTASEKGYYDLILMDLQMPIMNGYEATSALRKMKREDIKNIPIVAMTANAFLEDVQRSKACGMNEHMSKPLDIEQLQQMLARWLGRKKNQ